MQTEIRIKISKPEYEGLLNYLMKYHEAVELGIDQNQTTQLSIEAVTVSDFILEHRKKWFAWEFRNTKKLYTLTMKRHEALAIHQLMSFDVAMPPYLHELYMGINRQLINLVPFKLLTTNEVIASEYFV